jgi:vitamin K-dependent gamma-carboxylase
MTLTSGDRLAGEHDAGRPASASDGRVVSRLWAPVDVASLVVFRVLFGLLVIWEMSEYVRHGWIDRYWVEPNFHFTYYGFEWVEPLSRVGMWAVFGVIVVCGAAIALGAYVRLAAAVFTVAFGYTFTLEAARYLNHFYLFCLVGLLLVVVPANRRLSVDALLRPEIRSDVVPTWSLWLLRFQLGVVYVYGGLAKLNGDWLRGEPMRAVLADRTDLPLLGRFAGDEWLVWATSYGALLFDLLVVPLLLWRRTRVIALIAAIAFHLLNRELFNIGVFPWFALAGTLLFLDPSWPRAILRRLRVRTRPVTGGLARPATWRTRVGAAALVAFVAVQLLVPLRHYLYPGPSNWTEEGNQFAWHMMLRRKAGQATFVAVDPRSGRSWNVDPTRILTPWQVNKMSVHPEFLRQFAVEVADRFRGAGYEDIEVYTHAYASLNGRPPQLLVNPEVDLAAEPRRLTPQPWILPLDEPLP